MYVFFDQGRIVVLAVVRAWMAVGGGHIRTRDQNPFVQRSIERELNVAATDIGVLFNDFWLQRVGDFNHGSLLKHEPAFADRHHFDFLAALLSRKQVAMHFHVVDVHVAVEVIEAARMGMRVLIGKKETRQ